MIDDMTSVRERALFEETAGPVITRNFRQFLTRSMRLLRRYPVAAAGAAILLATVLAAAFAPILAPYDPNQVAAGTPLMGPSADHWMGTDQLGRDLMSRIIYGARVSVVVGIGVVMVSTSLALVVGLVAGYVGGWLDLVVQRVVDAVQAMPGLIVVLALVTFLGRGLFVIILVIGLNMVASTSRVVRSGTISVKPQPYVEAAVAAGATRSRIILRHVLPNVLPIIVVLASLQVGAAILIEGALSFLGYGVEPPTPTWGGILGVEGRQSLMLNPWMVVFPTLALSLVVLAANLLGDTLRDVLDPRLRGRH